MEKKYFPRKFKIYLPLIVLTVLLVFLMPTASKFNYDYKKGEPWMYETLVSKFDFPILKRLGQTDLGVLESARPRIASELTEIYSKGVIARAPQRDSSAYRVLLVQRDRRTVKQPVSEVYTFEQAQQQIYDVLASVKSVQNLDSVYNATGMVRIIEPDLILDQQTTDRIHK